jgi:rRNA maturation RNase YbeY
MLRAKRLKPERDWGDISIVLTDNRGITELNTRYLQKSEITDVLSFCYPPIPGENGLYAGEIIINAELAAKEGNRRKRTSESGELALYLAHGCDHLQDQEDYEPADRRRMRRRELRWLKIIADETRELVEGLYSS